MPFDLTLPDWIGILGSLIIAAGYFAVSSGRTDAEKPPFQVLNLIGAILVLISLYYRPNPGAILIELLWVGIAVYALVRFIFGKR
ncbi:MAG: hypothetical protein GXP03_08705 [Alphaproteobacteria bacterium]|nr:hypothetical protein [Alphaproteobacteria bacterium]